MDEWNNSYFIPPCAEIYNFFNDYGNIKAHITFCSSTSAYNQNSFHKIEFSPLSDALVLQLPFTCKFTRNIKR